jgi:hypothetical protein
MELWFLQTKPSSNFTVQNCFPHVIPSFVTLSADAAFLDTRGHNQLREGIVENVTINFKEGLRGLARYVTVNCNHLL